MKVDPAEMVDSSLRIDVDDIAKYCEEVTEARVLFKFLTRICPTKTEHVEKKCLRKGTPITSLRFNKTVLVADAVPLVSEIIKNPKPSTNVESWKKLEQLLQNILSDAIRKPSAILV